MFRRSPKYAVTTLALVSIAVAAFGLKFASLYLPERRPNRLASEYGAYVNRSQRQTIDWYPFDHHVFDLSQDQEKIVLLDLGSTVSLSAKTFSESYATDDEYERLLHDHFEAIKADALEVPWLADALAVELGPLARFENFVVVAMDPEGAILAWSTLLPKGGDESLAEWLSGLARLRYSNREQLEDAAQKSLNGRQAAAETVLSHASAEPEDIAAWSRRWDQSALAGVFLNARLPVSTLTMEVLLGSGNTKVWGQGLTLMLALAQSPCYDPIGGGVFVYARQVQWRQPVVSKVPGHSLQVAAAFAEAGMRFDLPLFRWIAAETAQWAMLAIEDGLFIAAEGTDQNEVGDSPHYALEAADIERTPFELDEQGLPRIRGKASFPQSVGSAQTDAVARASDALRAVRQEKPKLRPDLGSYANLNGQAISGLFAVGTSLGRQEMLDSASAAYQRAVDTFLLPLGDVRHAPAHIGNKVGYGKDYAWMARAGIEGFMATGNEAMLADTEQISGRMVELFATESGALMSYLPSLLEFVNFDFPVYDASDDTLPSFNAIAAENLFDLAALTGKSEYREAALRILRAFSGRFGDNLAPAGLLLAGRKAFAPLVLAAGRDFPATVGDVRIAPAPRGRFSRPGYYLVRGERVEGPFSLAEVRVRLARR